MRPIDTDLIFFGEPGRDKVRRPYEFRPAWQCTRKQTRSKGLRFHDLRHEAVSRVVEAGLGDQEVATISGHRSMQMLRRSPNWIGGSRRGNALFVPPPPERVADLLSDRLEHGIHADDDLASLLRIAPVEV